MATISAKYLIGGIVIVMALIAVNIYQYRNPKVVVVPEGQTQIDSTAWLRKSMYAVRGLVLDSLKKKNRKLAARIKESGDKIASYTAIIGKLRLKADSLQKQANSFDISSVLSAVDNSKRDTTFVAKQSFSNGLFEVQSINQFSYPEFSDRIHIEQKRDIKLSVTNTVNDDRSRVLTYITSPDFSDLHYSSYTELKRKRRWPWFWIGLGTGFVGGALIIN